MPAAGDWEANTERRVGILEKKMDDLLSPLDGIYPAMGRVETRLRGYAIAILTALVLNLLGMLTLVLYSRGK